MSAVVLYPIYYFSAHSPFFVLLSLIPSSKSNFTTLRPIPPAAPVTTTFSRAWEREERRGRIGFAGVSALLNPACKKVASGHGQRPTNDEKKGKRERSHATERGESQKKRDKKGYQVRGHEESQRDAPTWKG